MSLLSNLQLMSSYNQQMNQKIYQAAKTLGEAKTKEDRGAFFGSLFGTLNHIYVADIIWLKRFAQHPKAYSSLQNLPTLASYTALDAIVADNLENLSLLRQKLDTVAIVCPY
ncbi:MAG: hypothetical protein Tsb0014_29170 [Pleurocapsa sp.]